MERGGTVGILAVEPVAREDREPAVGGERLEALVQPLEIGAAVHAAGELHAHAVHHERGDDEARAGQRRHGRLEVEIAQGDIAMALEERGVLVDPVALRVHRIHHAAADAGRARLDAPRDGAVPARDGTRRERLGSAAAERVQAVALLLLHAAEPVDEFAVLEMTAPGADDRAGRDGAAMGGFDYAALRASLALVSSRTNV